MLISVLLLAVLYHILSWLVVMAISICYHMIAYRPLSVYTQAFSFRGIYEMNETAHVICELYTYMDFCLIHIFTFTINSFDRLMNNEHSHIMTFNYDELFTWRSLIFV